MAGNKYLNICISDHLYKSFGLPAIQKIPSNIKASLEKVSDDLNTNFQNIPPGYQLTEKQVKQLSAQVAYKTQHVVTKGISNDWEAFQLTEKEKGMKDLERNGIFKRDGSLNKRDILDKIRARFKFFQIDPTKKWWVVPLVSLVIILFTFAILLPEMTLAVGIWQTILQFGFIQPVISKLFLGYYFYDSKGSSAGPRVPSPGPILTLEDQAASLNSVNYENHS